jgi:hypothetical protein
MRWRQKTSLFLLGFSLAFLEPTGQAAGLLVKEVKTFGKHEMAIDLGGRTSNTVSILASDQPGNQLVLGKALTVQTQDGRQPQQLGSSLVANEVTLAVGERKWAEVQYDGNNYLVPVVIRAWASQGTVLNDGQLIVTDNKDNPNQASFRFVLSARNSVPTWQILLGLALWLIPGGQLGTFILWGNTSNTGSVTIAVDPRSGTKTIYYTYTGCTALADYNGSFTLDPGNVPAGQAIVLNVQGWCGGAGVGNWARVSQAVTVPPDFHNYSRIRPAFTFEALGYRFTYPFSFGTYIRGPDDCGGTYTDGYPASGGGINFVISGADCDANMWGAPGKPERSYTRMPSLTLYTNASPIYPDYLYIYDPRSGNYLGASASYRYALSWTTRTFTYQPSPYVPGNAYMVPISSRLPDGTTVNTWVPRFDIYGHTDGMGIIYGNPIGVSLPDLVIPHRNAKCTFENRTANQSFRVYLLDPPGTYRASSLSGGSVPAVTYDLPAGRRLSLPPGLYIVGSSNGNTVYPNRASPDGRVDLYVQGCNILSQGGYYSEGAQDWVITVDISPAFLAY